MEAVPRIEGHPNEIAHRIAAASIFSYLLAEDIIGHEYEPCKFGIQTMEYWVRMAERMDQPLNDDLDPDRKKVALGTEYGQGPEEEKP